MLTSGPNGMDFHVRLPSYQVLHLGCSWLENGMENFMSKATGFVVET